MLFERDGLLTALHSALTDARRGRGRLVLIGGESGIGKSSLVQRFTATSHKVRALLGVCDGARPARPMGPLTDIAEDLGPSIAQQLRGSPDRLDLFRRVLAALGGEPTIFVIEDLQWADEATTDFVRYVGRRLHNLPVVVVVTYRNDTLGADHPLVAVLGDLASSSATVRLQVPPLTADAVKEWVRTAGSSMSAGRLHERTSGNPFFISEVLAAGSDDIPAGVRDAVLARAARLSPQGRAVLDAAAVAGPPATPDMVLATAGLRAAGLAASGLDECLDGGFLLFDGHYLTFRHDLAMQTIDGSLGPAARTFLAAHALGWLQRHACTDDRRLATLADRAGDAAAVLAHGPRAARRASELGAHTEAVHHLRAAVRFRRQLPDQAQARLLDALSYECYLTERPAEALECRQLALELHRSSGDTLSVGGSQRWLSRISWMLGRTSDAHQLGAGAVHTLEALPAGAELAMAYSNMSQLFMLAGEADASIDWGRRAIELATELGADDVLMHAQNNVGAALGCAGRLDQGVALLETSLDLALAHDAQEHVARAFCNLASVCVSNHCIDAAQRYLDAAFAYCAERDLDTWRLSIETEVAGAELAAGRWDAALRRCAEILRNRGGSAVIRVTALWVMGIIEVRRGLPGAQAHLNEAQTLAARMHDPQTRIPVALARAEAAWTQGRFAATWAEVDRVFPLAAQSGHGWWLGEVAWWSMLSGPTRIVPSTTEPHDLMLGGQWQAGADAWERRRNPFWRALCLAQSDDPGHARTAHTLLTSLDATATLQVVQREWQRRGVPVPRGARATRRGDSHGLTERELDVVELLGEGLSNAEIADRLVIAERTAAHHVSAVLRKLDAPSRARAVATARRLGIVAHLEESALKESTLRETARIGTSADAMPTSESIGLTRLR